MTSEQLLGKRILLAEDCPDTVLLLSYMLQSLGIEAAIAKDGRECLEMALHRHREGNPFDLILLDINMPVVNGNEATQRLRSEGYGKPIVAMTADATFGGKGESLVFGFDSYVSKRAINKDFLRQLVTTHCN